MASKPRGDVTRSLKQGCQWPHKKRTYVLKKIKTTIKQVWAILATSKGQSQNNIPSIVLFLTLYPPQCLGHALNSDHSENLQTWTSHVTSHFCVVSGIKPNWWIQNSSGTASFRSMHLTTTKSKSSSWSCCLNSSVRVQVWIGGFTNPKGLAPTYCLTEISRKLNQNDENWTGGRVQNFTMYIDPSLICSICSPLALYPLPHFS